MSDPVKYCLTCQRVRNCYKHMRASLPPRAAEKWLRKTCPRDGSDCEIRYQAGISERLMEQLRELRDK